MKEIKQCTNKVTGDIFDYIDIKEKNKEELGIVLRSCKSKGIQQGSATIAIGNDKMYGLITEEQFNLEFTNKY